MTDTLALDAEAANELDAYRSGYCQLAWDPHTDQSPHHATRDSNDEPTVHVQHTYNGQPAWLCAVCLQVTLADTVTDGQVCRGCGEVDTLSAMFHQTPCINNAHAEAAA